MTRILQTAPPVTTMCANLTSNTLYPRRRHAEWDMSPASLPSSLQQMPRHLCRIRTHLNVAIITVYLPTSDTSHKLILNMITQHSQVYYVSQILHFETQIALRFVPVASVTVHVSLRRTLGMSDKQFLYADRVVFSTSKVC